MEETQLDDKGDVPVQAPTGRVTLLVQGELTELYSGACTTLHLNKKPIVTNSGFWPPSEDLK